MPSVPPHQVFSPPLFRMASDGVPSESQLRQTERLNQQRRDQREAELRKSERRALVSEELREIAETMRLQVRGGARRAATQTKRGRLVGRWPDNTCVHVYVRVRWVCCRLSWRKISRLGRGRLQRSFQPPLVLLLVLLVLFRVNTL